MQIRDKIKSDLEQNLSPKCYCHTLSVMYTAAALAMRYHEDIDKAMLAGLLHDCVKERSLNDMLELCTMQNVSISNLERKNPHLLHSKAGAAFANTKYKIEDFHILEAIRCHTTGKPDMNTLDKILFLADYIEPNRNEHPHLEEVRRLAFVDIDKGLLSALTYSLNYLKDKQAEIDKMTIQAYQYYKNKE
jgi:putative HD superfamily hydrolase of NAD metabolism